MFTWGPKYLFGVSLAALIGAWVYGLTTGGDLLGVLSVGYKGGVGEHVGYSILLGVFVVAQILSWLLVANRDGDAETLAHRVGVDVVPAVSPPTDPSYWGLVTAFGVACVIVGLSVSMTYFYMGIAVIFVAAVMWLLLAWSDRATGDPEVNRIVRDRAAEPFEIPVLAILTTAVGAVGMSRVFLATSATGSVIAGAIVTLLVFGGAVIFSRVDVKPSVARAVLVFGGVAVIAAGIIGAAVGERDFHHEAEHGDIEGEGE